MKQWTEFNKDTILKIHGDMYTNRMLYQGKHSDIFPRAKHLLSQGELTDRLRHGDMIGKQIKTPYIMANVCKWIIDTPTTFMVRALGDIKTNYPAADIKQGFTADDDLSADDEAAKDKTAMIEGTIDNNAINSEVYDLQQETLDQITKNSKLNHKMNIVQWQLDGGIVSVPSIVNGQVKIEIKERNVYFPHDDGQGYDLVYELEQTQQEADDNIEYVHVYSEFEENNVLYTSHRLYERIAGNQLEQVLDLPLIQERLGIKEVFTKYSGRFRSFIEYLPYNPTFMEPLGVSALEGLQGRQDEVNWTFTRSSQTFERNGKPRLSITKQTMSALKSMAQKVYGNENMLDHRWLEILEMDQNGRSMEVHQIDVTKIGDIPYVKDIIRTMLTETQTSEAALEFVKEGSSGAQSGVAKFYDLMVTLIKSEEMLQQYVDFLQRSYENALWLANKINPDIIIEQPNIMLSEMVPMPRAEVSVANSTLYKDGVQSLEETVRRNNPDMPTEWIDAEIERINSSKTSQDSMTMALGNMTAANFMNNRNADGEPLDEAGNVIKGEVNADDDGL